MIIVVNIMNKEPYIISLKTAGTDEEGLLTVADKQLPFKPQRVYWIYNTPDNVKRGGHAQKVNENVLVCIQGRVEILIEDKARERYYYLLDSSTKALVVPPNHWKEFVMSTDAILLCLASEEYDESDYIRVKDQFYNL